jgi:hypothetical protein
MSIIDRVKNILITPKTEWPVIEAETKSIAEIYTSYLIFLAAIPAIASFIGFSLIGMGGFGFSYRVPIAAGISGAILSFLMMLAVIYLLSLIVNALAPTFEGTKNHLNAFKLVAYSYTASMVAGIFMLMPSLAIIGLIGGLYSLYLLYTGLPKMMKNPESKTLPYFVVVLICGIVAAVLMTWVTSCVSPRGPSFGDLKHGGGDISINTPMGKVEVQATEKKADGGKVTIKGPGGAEIKVETTGGKDGTVTINAPGANVTLDAAKMEEFAKQMEAAGKKMEEANKSGDPAAAMKALQEAMQGMKVEKK